MSLIVKVSLYHRHWHSEPVEVRRFTVDQEVATSFTYLRQKLAQVFPSIQDDNNITVAWIGQLNHFLCITHILYSIIHLISSSSLYPLCRL